MQQQQSRANEQAKERQSHTLMNPSIAPTVSSTDQMASDSRGDGVTIERHGIFDELNERWVHMYGEVRYGVVPGAKCGGCGGTHPTETCGGQWLQFWCSVDTTPDDLKKFGPCTLPHKSRQDLHHITAHHGKGSWYDHPDSPIHELWEGRYAKFARPWPERKKDEIPFPPEYYCKTAFKTATPGLQWDHSKGGDLDAGIETNPQD